MSGNRHKTILQQIAKHLNNHFCGYVTQNKLHYVELCLCIELQQQFSSSCAACNERHKVTIV